MHTPSFDEVGHKKPRSSKFNEVLWTIIKQVYIDYCYKAPSMDSKCWGAIAKTARKIGAKRDNVSSWLIGKCPIPPKYIEKLAALSNGRVKPDELRIGGLPDVNVKAGDKIKQLRERMGLSRTQFSLMVGDHYSTICGVEKGRYLPSLKIVMKIMRAFNLTNIYDLVEVG